VADYLLQHLTRQRRSTHLPAPAWQALTEHPHPHDDLTRLADSAQQRLLYRYAEPLRRHGAADAGDGEAAFGLAQLLFEQGRTDELRQRADAGNGRAASLLAELLAEQGRTDELRQRADAGNGKAASLLAELLAE
jgi:hypothetical protein